MTDNRFWFRRRSRLIRRSQFDYVFQKPARLSYDGLTVLFRHNRCGFARLGLVVSKKFARKAVARNRIKRLIRESFRCYARRLGSRDIIVIGRHGLEEKDNKELRTILERFWAHIGKCKNS